MSKPQEDKNVDVPDNLIKELLTESEWRMVKQRLQIIKLLEDGLTIRAIAERAKVGTDTVVRVSKKFESSKVLRGAFRKMRFVPGTSKWIFGKNDASS